MDTIKYILILAVVAAGIFFIIQKSPLATAPVSNGAPTTSAPLPVELCFAKFGEPNERGFYDADTLRMTLAGEKVTGELDLLPAEKDSKTGTFDGTVGPVDPTMMARKAQVWWRTTAEGMNTTEELRIIFGEGTASIGMGEMTDRGDGVYVYKDPENISYTLELSDVSCKDLTERESVEKYLKANISVLSPVKAVLGGAWHVVSYTADISNNSGTVMYEDGHIQEKKDFSYTTNDAGEVTELHMQ
jgi:hypothetical protein